MSIEGNIVPIFGADEFKLHDDPRELENSTAARIGEVAAELVKGEPAAAREWIGNFKTGDNREVQIWMPTFPRMVSGAVGDALCQIEVTYPWRVFQEGPFRYKEIWNLSSTLHLGFTSKVETQPAGAVQAAHYEYPSEQIRARVEEAERLAARGEFRAYRQANPEEEKEVLDLLEGLNGFRG